MKSDAFIVTVQQSRALSGDQKQDIIEAASDLSTSTKEDIVSVLRAFDESSINREQHLREQLEDQYQRFSQRLEEEGVDEEEKKQLLAKARNQMKLFFTAPSSSV